ncbi:MAG TPA: hypothetical protein VIG46_11855, partial [Candidatus Baltobacteraceae bacterium]
YRIGDIHSPRLANGEALVAVIRHFAEVIDGRTQSIMSGERGLRVVRILEEGQKALDATLQRNRDARRSLPEGEMVPINGSKRL